MTPLHMNIGLSFFYRTFADVGKDHMVTCGGSYLRALRQKEAP